ncbi:MAG: beta-lactamase family protein [Gemmatimonadota bacterium]|nr:MAG: beta-lactamase family protein [Gemmatimonadota bacterium]
MSPLIPLPFIAIMAVLATPLRCQTTGTLPDTPPGRRLAEFITIVNSGDYDSIRAYAEGSFSEGLIAGTLDARVDALMRIHAQSQQLTVVRVLSTSRERVIAEVSNQLAEMNQALGVSVERRRPHRITMWYRGPAYLYGEPEGAPQLAESEILAAVDSFLDRLSAADVFSGAVLIGKGDSILLQRAVGLARRAPAVANGPGTRFNIASVGKLFTTVAIAQLAEQGLLTYGDAIDRYLGPEWVSPDAASEIRIEHLLTHRSGLGDFLESDVMLSATAPPRSLDDYQPIIRAERPQFRPGTRFQYSNSGFIVLGAIVERISGRSFADYFHQRVFEPAGMVAMSDPPRDGTALPAPAFATGYTSRFSASGRAWGDNTRRLANTAASPAGGQFVSAEDLWRFAVALRSGALVSDSMWQSLAAPAQVSGGPPSGYGFEILDRGQERRVGHGGSHEGIGAVLDIYLQSHYTLVVLSNSDRSAFAVREKFASLMFR